MPVFTRQYTLEKKLAVGEMLIEQDIEFELNGPGPPGRAYTPTAVIFITKQKSFKEDLRVDYFII